MEENNKSKKHNLIDNLINEAASYTSIDRIENLIEYGRDFSALPVQPLYVAIKNMPPKARGKYLECFSQEQRQIFLDLDLWHRDSVIVQDFSDWIQSYSSCPNKSTQLEFVQSSEFYLFLKARFNIWTFDIEDPHYPDHDNYFLTDDNLLLFEFDENIEIVQEVQDLIRLLYAEKGVENAYSYLFKLISDQYSTFEEEEYQNKKKRLVYYGFVDYYDALEIDTPFPKIELLENFIQRKISLTGKIDKTGQLQTAYSMAIVPYQKKSPNLDYELGLVRTFERQQYLQFNFLRLVNAVIEINNALKGGSISLNRSGSQCLNLLELGLDYVKCQSKNDKPIFELYDFTDIYKIGNSQQNHNKLISFFYFDTLLLRRLNIDHL